MFNFVISSVPADGITLSGAKATFTHARSGCGADFDIPATLPRVCSHIRGADAERMQADLPFLEDNDGLERAVSKRAR